MREFHQGSIDTFCAAYAVLNALQITHGIKALEARVLFNELLLTLAQDTMIFTKVLTLKTNYVAMTEFFLEHAAKKYPIKVTKPFKISDKVNAEMFWETLSQNLDPDNNKTAIFQFEKRISTINEPIFAHWTTTWAVEDKELHLFDCSPERNAIKRLHKNNVHFELLPRNSEQVSGEYFCINAHTLSLIEAV